jgi:hypothetical protein
VDQEVAANAATNRHDFLVTLEHALKQQKADVVTAEKQAKAQEEEARAKEAELHPEPEPEVPALRLAKVED